MVKYVPGAQKAYDEAVAYYFRLLLERCLPPMSSGLFFIPDNIKTQKMCERAIEDEPRSLALVPNHLKTQGMCIKAVEACPWLLKYVPDWILTQEQVKLWNVTIIIAIMSSLSGTKAIKNERPKKQK